MAQDNLSHFRVFILVFYGLAVQVEADGEKVDVCGQWNLASPLLPITVNGTERMFQVNTPSFFFLCQESTLKMLISLFLFQCLSREASGTIVLQYMGTMVRLHVAKSPASLPIIGLEMMGSSC